MTDIPKKKAVEKLLKAVRKLEGLMEAHDLDGAAKLVVEIERRAAEAEIQSSASLKWIEAIILDNKGDHEPALDAIDVAVQLDPLAVAYNNSRQVILRNISLALANPSRPADQANTPRLWAALVHAGVAGDSDHLCLARFHLAVGATEEALNVLVALTTLSPGNADAWLLRVALATKLERPEAVAAAQAAAAGASAVAFITPVVGES
jgi:tetratricopeptide (TPR) repeat protein